MRITLFFLLQHFNAEERIQDELVFRDTHVIRSSLDLFVPVLNSKYAIANSDCPLFALRLPSLLSAYSVLGTDWAHILGDGTTACLFAHKRIKEVEGIEVDEMVKPLTRARNTIIKITNVDQMPYFDLPPATPRRNTDIPAYQDIFNIAKKIKVEISNLQVKPEIALPL
uniref:Uncharacterized protein n=1 Tax=Kwoniella pini CBS 10737 TaxID=1296096 RepID=A0A1B9HS71_9TREE|nr:uncharacterized protein I206_07910 [Kwoniella pini CBS 10737]OCF46125.1 hypothetical protein I206_07910 [Kwoniella pini CBS 10737]